MMTICRLIGFNAASLEQVLRELEQQAKMRTATIVEEVARSLAELERTGQALGMPLLAHFRQVRNAREDQASRGNSCRFESTGLIPLAFPGGVVSASSSLALTLTAHWESRLTGRGTAGWKLAVDKRSLPGKRVEIKHKLLRSAQYSWEKKNTR